VWVRSSGDRTIGTEDRFDGTAAFLFEHGPLLKVAAEVLEAVTAHARRATPSECCGVLVGTTTMIVEAVAANNLADTPTRFLIDPRDHIATMRDARRRGLRVVGFYHSHPKSPAVPSETDRREANYPDHFYLIVGLASQQADIRVFMFDGHDFVETRFDVA
jgi:proteasome lid subunit RPN8/RPN11